MAADAFDTGPIGSTCRYTAALRHVESTQVKHPIIVDPLAPHLCGDAALQLAQQELHNLQAAQGFGKHLRVPMRTRILEDWLLEDLRARQAKGSSAGGIQVVSLGAGLDTRSWRLAFPEGMIVHWVCLDLPEVMTMKHALLEHAGAQMTPRQGFDSCGGSNHASRGSKSTISFPLRCASWHGLDLDLSTLNTAADAQRGELGAALAQAGFEPQLPTVWVMEAVLYYMPLTKAEALLTCLAGLSAASSSLICTCVDTELLEASRHLDAGHIFANLWHFDCNDLLKSPGFTKHWQVVKLPKTTRDIGLESYNVDTYIALYGGAECALTAVLA